jgi:ABC-type transport system involved in multi-copper enzyme maturation permease subunit
MIRLIRAEFLKVRTTQVWFWLLLLTIAVSALLVVAQIAPHDGVKDASDVPQIFASAVSADIVVFILGVLAVTTEFRYQTITPTVLQTPSRWTIVSAKMITYAILGVVYAVIAVAVQLAVSVPWLSAKGIQVDYGSGPIIHSIIGVFGVMALYGIVGLGVGALLRNQIVAVVVGIIFLLVLQNVVLAIPVVKYAYLGLPGGAVTSILRTTESSEIANGVHVTSTGIGVLVLILWAFIPAVLGAAFTMNRDIT